MTMRESIEPDMTPVGPEREFTIKARTQGQMVRRRFIRHRGAAIGFSALSDRGHHGVHLDRLLEDPRLVVLGVHVDQPDRQRGSTQPWTSSPGSSTATDSTVGPHPFGQDQIGRDYFALTMRGTQISLMVAFVIGILSTFLGAVAGAISGYYGGRADNVIMRFTDLLLTIPILTIAAVVGNAFGKLGPFFLAVVLSLLIWTSLARLVRGEFLSLREKEYVEAARAMGASSPRIIFRHMLPNAIGTIIVSATLTIAVAILLEAALSFLGFGIQAPDTSLGLLISTYQTAFSTRPWLFWWPGLFIVVIALSVNFIGDGLRDAFDPKQNRVRA